MPTSLLKYSTSSILQNIMQPGGHISIFLNYILKVALQPRVKTSKLLLKVDVQPSCYGNFRLSWIGVSRCNPSRHTMLFHPLQDVYTTSETSYRLLEDVETTSCVYWDIKSTKCASSPFIKFCFLELCCDLPFFQILPLIYDTSPLKINRLLWTNENQYHLNILNGSCHDSQMIVSTKNFQMVTLRYLLLSNGEINQIMWSTCYFPSQVQIIWQFWSAMIFF